VNNEDNNGTNNKDALEDACVQRRKNISHLLMLCLVTIQKLVSFLLVLVNFTAGKKDMRLA
jgi:hypothetical protein